MQGPGTWTLNILLPGGEHMLSEEGEERKKKRGKDEKKGRKKPVFICAGGHLKTKLLLLHKCTPKQAEKEKARERKTQKRGD